MAIFEIKHWTGGLSSREDAGAQGSYKFASGNDPRTGVDSLTCQQALIDIGLDDNHSPSASPSPSSSVSSSPSSSASSSASATPSPSASPSPSSSVSASPSATPSASLSASPSPSAGLTTVFEDLVHFWVKASDGYTYGFGNTGCIYRIDQDYYCQRVCKMPGAIKGAAEWFHSDGTDYIYFALDTVLYRKSILGLANWNDVEQVGTLNSATWHTMRESGGTLVICNGSWLAMVGWDKSYTNEALNLIPGNIANTLVERNGRTVTGTYKTGYPTKGVNAMIDGEYPLSQVGDEGYIYYADMNDSMPAKKFPGGGRCNPGGVANMIDSVPFFEWEQTARSWISKKDVGNLSMFAVFGADMGKNGIYTYGRKQKDSPFILNLDYPLEADELGALVAVEGIPMVSYRDGSDFGVKIIDTNNKATCIYEGLDLRAKADKPIDIVPWNTAEVEMKTMPANCKVQFWYKLNKQGSFIQAKTANNSDEALGGKKAVFRLGCEAEIFEPRLVLIPYGNTTPEVFRLLINFGQNG